MYKVSNVGGQLVGGQWKWDDLVINVPPKPDEGGVYIQCAHAGRDNPNLSTYYDTVFKEGLRVGFYIVLEDGDVSYANQILSLIQWYKGGRKLGLPPAIVFAGSDKTPHVIRGDFESYFKQFVIDSPDVPYVVLGFNESSLKQILTAGNDDITGFKNLITNPKVRLWMHKYGEEYPSWIGCFKSVWMWSKSASFAVVDYVPPTEPPTTPAEPVVVETPVTCQYQVLVDVWEGQVELDEAVLKAAGVAGIIVRLNDMNGGHHMDTGFTSQWEQAAGFVRAPYFVYNPWVSGKANFDWLAASCPAGVKRVFVDVEVIYSAVTPAQYGKELAAFLGLARGKWNITIYTGQWFLPFVTPWDGGEYWWARYPNSLYVAGQMTWAALMTKLNALPWTPGSAPGVVKLWQCTADRIVLPGCGGRAIDINVFKGSRAELEAWIGGEPVVDTLTYEQKVDALWAAHPELHK